MEKRKEILKKLKEYKPVLEKKYGVIRLGIFGSVARGDIKNNSDIDIVVEIKKNEEPFILLDIKEELVRLFGCDIDVIRLRKNLNKFLKKRIESEVIYV